MSEEKPKKFRTGFGITRADHPCVCDRQHCTREGILVMQYVMPNRYEKAIPATSWHDQFILDPRVFRHYLCRWHKAAENNPNHWDFNGSFRREVEFVDDEKLIHDWLEIEFTTGDLSQSWEL